MKDKPFYENLFAAKKELGKISKDSKNPFFNSKYFDVNKLLETVEPVLNKHGLFVLQPIEDDVVKTRICDDTGFSVESGIKLPDIKDPQKIGSCVTYYRRYTLQSLLALQAEDDDANLASDKKVAKKPSNDLPWLNKGSKEWKDIEVYVKDGFLKSVDQVTKFRMSKETEQALIKLIEGEKG